MKYYSFWVGSEHATRKEWMLIDLKIPATNIKEALFIYFASREYRRNQKNVGVSADNRVYHPPSIGYIVHEIKRVEEYDRLYTPKNGYTQHKYKKIRYYSYHVVLAMYEGYKVSDFL